MVTGIMCESWYHGVRQLKVARVIVNFLHVSDECGVGGDIIAHSWIVEGGIGVQCTITDTLWDLHVADY